MHKLIFGVLLALPLMFATSAQALPGSTGHASLLRDAPIASHDVIEVKGGKGWKIGRGHMGRPFGWSRGRKVGWRGHHCPPGLWTQGRC